MAFRILLLTGWLLLGVAGAVAHCYGPGVTHSKLDRAAQHIGTAEKSAAQQDYATTIDQYEAALKVLPEGYTAQARKIRLEKAKAQMLNKQLPEAHTDLRTMVDELIADPTADQKLLADARSAQANSQYYMTWLMRLEGQGREVWEPEAESARQNYKMLAEEAAKKGDSTASKKHGEDLEASIRLARIDLSELQGLPLPSQ